MSSSLEGVIRPFETGDVSPSKPLPQGDPGEPPDNLIIKAVGGPPHTFSGSFSVDISYYHVKKPKEKRSAAQQDISGGNNTTPVGPEGEPPVG